MEEKEKSPSLAMVILHDYKKQTLRQFIIICSLLGIILTFAVGVVFIIINFENGYAQITEEAVTNAQDECIGDDC